MIFLLTGNNDFEISKFITSLKQNYDGQIDMVDGFDDLDLTALLLSQSLFSSTRLVIIKELSANKDLWNTLPSYLSKINSDDILVLVEPTPDRRTRTYKDILGFAEHKNFDKFEPKTHAVLKKWLLDHANSEGIELNEQMAELIIGRVGYDQWALVNALDRISLAGRVSEQLILEQTEPSPTENIFQLFETALRGDNKRVLEMVSILKLSEDAYKTLGLISSQLMLILAIKSAEKGQDVSRDFSANPYMISKLEPLALKTPMSKLKKAAELLYQADQQSKTSSINPWISLEQAMLKISCL